MTTWFLLKVILAITASTFVLYAGILLYWYVRDTTEEYRMVKRAEQWRGRADMCVGGEEDHD